MAKKDQDLSLTIGFEADKESLKEALDDVKNEIKKEQKKGKATVKVSASADDNTDIDRVIHNKVKDPKKHNALSMLLSEAGGSWERFATAADYHAGTFSPVQTRGKGGVIIDPEGGKTINAGGLAKHTNAVTDAVEAQIKRENAYARKHKLDTIKQAEQDDILAASALHDRFKYTDTGKLNPNAMKDAASWAKIYGLEGAYDILSDPESRGARIISAVDYATSQESRWADMDQMGNWKDKDFDVLDAAVKSGEGRWKDPDSAHVVDNFEIINDATQEENENLEDWRDNLKGIIGDLGIIALLMKGMKAVMKFDQWAEQTVKSTAEGLPTRSNIGATSTDLYRMRSASGYLNLDKNAIYDSVSALAERQGEFATTGQGLELFYGSVAQGLEPILKNMNDPIEAWNQAMDVFLKELTTLKEAGDQQGIDKLLNSIQKFMGDDAKKILSRIIDFNFDTQTTNDIKNMGALYDKSFDNPYAWESERAEAVNSELNTLRESIQTTYSAIATDWEEYFGKPFKSWWNKFLIWFVDWYRSFTGIDKRELNSAGWLTLATESISGAAFSYQDLKNTAKGAKYSSVRNVGIAEEVWNKLPDYLKQVLNESASNGKFDYKNANNWNLIMAAEAIKNQDEHGNPYAQEAKTSRLRSAMKKAGMYKGGYLGWLAEKYAADAGVNNTDVTSWSDEEQKTFSKYLHDKGIDITKEYTTYFKSVMNDTDPIKTGKFDKDASGTLFARRWSKEYKNAAFGTNESIRKMFTTDALDWMDNDKGISDKVTNYLNSRLQASGAGALLEDENVTNYERLFATRIANVLEDTTTSDIDKIEYINAFVDELIRQYAANGEYTKVLSGEESKDTAKAGDKTAMTNPTINITVNGVDTNNANEVAYAVSSELKPALAAQTDSVV